MFTVFLYFLPSVSKTIVIVGNPPPKKRSQTEGYLYFKSAGSVTSIFHFVQHFSTFNNSSENFCPQLKNFIKILLFASELRHTKDQPLPISHHVFYLCTSC